MACNVFSHSIYILFCRSLFPTGWYVLGTNFLFLFFFFFWPSIFRAVLCMLCQRFFWQVNHGRDQTKTVIYIRPKLLQLAISIYYYYYYSTMPESAVTLPTLSDISQRQATTCFKMADSKPEVECLSWISSKLQRFRRHFRPFPNRRRNCRPCPTSADHHNSKWRTINRK